MKDGLGESVAAEAGDGLGGGGGAVVDAVAGSCRDAVESLKSLRSRGMLALADASCHGAAEGDATSRTASEASTRSASRTQAFRARADDGTDLYGSDCLDSPRLIRFAPASWLPPTRSMTSPRSSQKKHSWLTSSRKRASSSTLTLQSCTQWSTCPQHGGRVVRELRVRIEEAAVVGVFRPNRLDAHSAPRPVLFQVARPERALKNPACPCERFVSPACARAPPRAVFVFDIPIT